ncbi:MAG: cation transporter [Methylotenera sp.]|jgi:cobalt-zinc-cadmium efflux system protein|nr:MAG: cation transporter [Methylotenera sp.]
MSAEHNHALPSTQNEKVLWVAFGLTTTFLIAEAVAGFLLNSLALLSDAAHMFTDSAALGIALAAVRIARKPADQYRTFGYHRFEILAATFNALLLFGVAIYILYEAWQRFRSPVEVQSVGMIVVACLGLVINFISIRLLSSGKDSSLNLKGAYLEVWSDLIGSIGVIVGGIIIYFTGWAWVDTIVAVGIGLWVLPRTWILLKESLNLLLEGVPLGIDIEEVEKEILSQKGVVNLHDLHLWGITSGKNSLTAHILMDGTVDSTELINSIQTTLSDKFAISHTTLQCETSLCNQAEVCTFIDSSNVLHEHSHQD